MLEEVTPISRIAPLVCTMPEMIGAIAASTLLLGRDLMPESVATFRALAAFTTLLTLTAFATVRTLAAIFALGTATWSVMALSGTLAGEELGVLPGKNRVGRCNAVAVRGMAGRTDFCDNLLG